MITQNYPTRLVIVFFSSDHNRTHSTQSLVLLDFFPVTISIVVASYSPTCFISTASVNSLPNVKCVWSKESWNHNDIIQYVELYCTLYMLCYSYAHVATYRNKLQMLNVYLYFLQLLLFISFLLIEILQRAITSSLILTWWKLKISCSLLTQYQANKKNYYSCKIHVCPCFWLVKTTHLSHMNSVKMTLLSMSSRSSVRWIECLPGVREVMGLIPVGDSDFSLSHTRVMLNISYFTFTVFIHLSRHLTLTLPLFTKVYK